MHYVDSSLISTDWCLEIYNPRIPEEAGMLSWSKKTTTSRNCHALDNEKETAQHLAILKNVQHQVQM